MYNDYYLQSIDSRLENLNDSFESFVLQNNNNNDNLTESIDLGSYNIIIYLGVLNLIVFVFVLWNFLPKKQLNHKAVNKF